MFHLTGYTPEEFYTDPFLKFKIIHKDDQPFASTPEKLITQNENDAGAIKQTVILRWIKKDGEVIWTETRNIPVYDDSGKMIAIEGISRDITKSKKDGEALRDSEERFRILSNASIEGIILSDRGIIIDVNERFLNIMGFDDRDEVIGKHIQDFIIRDSKKFVSNRLSNDGRTEVKYSWKLMGKTFLITARKSGSLLLMTSPNVKYPKML
jgi:PAS domain S-box-containing protein